MPSPVIENVPCSNKFQEYNVAEPPPPGRSSTLISCLGETTVKITVLLVIGELLADEYEIIAVILYVPTVSPETVKIEDVVPKAVKVAPLIELDPSLTAVPLIYH